MVQTSMEAEVALEATLMATEATMVTAIKAQTMIIHGRHRRSGYGCQGSGKAGTICKRPPKVLKALISIQT